MRSKTFWCGVDDVENKPKVETVEEFLARGGKITKIPPAEAKNEDAVVRPTTAHGIHQMSLDEGAHYFAEIKKKKSRRKKDPLKGINLDALPPEIRKLLDM